MDQELRNKNRLTFLNYNKKRHSELLEYLQCLEQQGKSLSHESRENFLELLNYSAVLDSQLDWEAQDYYLELLDQVVKKTDKLYFEACHYIDSVLYIKSINNDKLESTILK